MNPTPLFNKLLQLSDDRWKRAAVTLFLTGTSLSWLTYSAEAVILQDKAIQKSQSSLKQTIKQARSEKSLEQLPEESESAKPIAAQFTTQTPQEQNLRLTPTLSERILFAAAPENLNPALQAPPPRTVFDRNLSNLTFTQQSGLQIDFRNDADNFGQVNRGIESTLRFRVDDRNTLSLRTGINSFNRPNYDEVLNVPLQLGWQGQVGEGSLEAAIGVDFFDRLPETLIFSARADVPITRSLTFSGIVEQGAYKVNAQALENQITALRLGSNVYWQISPRTSLFSLVRFGDYNDGNEEFQTFNRFEHRIGQFYIAANLFNWSYDENVEQTSGYFSPPDFLVYTGELGWEGEVTDFLDCGLSIALGQQRLNGNWDTANDYRAKCTVQFSTDVELDLGYAYSNVQNRAGNLYENQSVTGQLRIRF